MDLPRVHSEPPSALSPKADSYAAIAVGLVVFVACVVGTLSRPVAFLSAFWPANALMLGLLLRRPAIGNHLPAWLWGAGAYVLSSLVMGDGIHAALWLSAANLTGVAAGWYFFKGLDRNTVMLRGTLSAPYLLCGCMISALGEALVGCIAIPTLFGGSMREVLVMWFSGALLCGMLILPVVLSAPSILDLRKTRLRTLRERFNIWHLAPLAALICSEIAAVMLGGPGSLVFGVPALIWCALRYSLFSTALLCLAVGITKSYTASLGLITYTPDHMLDALSLRLGITLLSFGPLAVASSQAVRNELLAKLNYAARHDALTGVLGRNTFLEQCAHWLQRLTHERRPSAALMIDLDNFKNVNDTYGHAAGDELLRGFTQLIQKHLRPCDLLGRMGGEEFAVMLPNVTCPEAQDIAQRLCDATRQHLFQFEDGQQLHITVSIGLVHQDVPPRHALIEQLLKEADHALYEAKGGGRNRVVLHAVAPAKP